MEAGINPLVFRLVGDAVGDNVIDLYVAIASVIGEGYANLASDIGCDGVIQHASSDCPGLYDLVTNFKDETFIFKHNDHTHRNTIDFATQAGEGDDISDRYIAVEKIFIYTSTV